MRMMKFLVITAASLGMLSAAVAADLPTRQPPPPVAPIGKAPIPHPSGGECRSLIRGRAPMGGSDVGPGLFVPTSKIEHAVTANSRVPFAQHPSKIDRPRQRFRRFLVA